MQAHRETLFPKVYAAVRDGIREAMEVGVLAGFPMAGIKANYSAVPIMMRIRRPSAFKIAGSLAFKNAARKPARSCWSRS